MSVIIRLQNLPLSAKSGDIRRFFGGLRIPNGGVHIVGGEKGEAFIEFLSGEEARKAMKEDGGVIKNCKIRLFPSTMSEMRHEIAQITGDLSFEESHERSPSVKSNSPLAYSDHSSNGRKKFTKQYRSDSSSRTGVIPRNSRSYTSSTRQPRLDRSKRSRSPRKSRSPRRSRSPRGYKSRRSRSPRNRSRSPRRSFRRTSRSPRRSSQSPLSEISSVGSARPSSPYKSGYLDASNSSAQASQISIEQAQLERKITEALERGYALDTPVVPQDPYPHVVPNQQFFNPVVSAPIVQNCEPFPNHNVNLPFAGPDYQVSQPQYPDMNVLNNPIPHYPPQGNNFQPGFMPQNNFPPLAPNPMGLPLPNPMALPEMMPPLTMPPPPIPHSQAPPLNAAPLNAAIPVPVTTMPPPPVQVDAGFPDGQCIPRGFYITLSGLDPHWNSEDLQNMLRGLFVPLNHIQFEQNDQGLKTGTAYVKLSNEDDFQTALLNRTYIFMSKIVTLTETPDCIYQRYFLPDWSVQDPKSVNLYYKLKGLPYYATVESMINFFKGLQLADLYIERNEFGKASGICWVSFKTTQDYHDAFKLNGAPLGHRVVHLKHTTKEEMIKKKRKNGDILSLSRDKSSISKSTSLEPPLTKPASRSLCAMLTGLPSDITPRRVANFFKSSGLEPDAIHVTLNNKNRPCGQAFVEFSSIRDFDSALLCHRNKIDNSIICVKQVLYEEMSKVLSAKRSMHSYSQNGKDSAPLNLPEKVPYLWQPPDGSQDPYSQQDNKYMFSQADVQDFDHVNQSSQQQAELKNLELGQGIPVLHDRDTNNMKKPFQKNNLSNLTLVTINNKRKRVRSRSRNYKRPDDQEKNQVVEPKMDILTSVSKNDATHPTAQKKADKVLVKVETKETDTKMETSDKNKPLQNTKVYDANKKETKPVAMKSEKKPDETENTQRGSKEKAPSSASSEKSEKNYNKNTSVRQSDRYEKRNEGGRRTENHGRDYGMQRQRTYSPSRHDNYNSPNPFQSDAEDYASAGPAVVQICNVHPSMGSQEIKRFLQGYRIDGEQIVRGYTDNQEPTGDVRVTFKTVHEAKSAIRNLNNQLLEGIPVTLFLV